MTTSTRFSTLPSRLPIPAPSDQVVKGLRLLAQIGTDAGFGRRRARELRAAVLWIRRYAHRPPHRLDMRVGAELWRHVDRGRAILAAQGVDVSRPEFLRWSLRRLCEELEAGRRVDWCGPERRLPTEKRTDRRRKAELLLPRPLLVRGRTAVHRLRFRGGLASLIRRSAIAFAGELERGHG